MDGVETAIQPTHYISGRQARALTTAQSLRHANSLGSLITMAYLTTKNSNFAPFARAFFIFVHFYSRSRPISTAKIVCFAVL